MMICAAVGISRQRPKLVVLQSASKTCFRAVRKIPVRMIDLKLAATLGADEEHGLAILALAACGSSCWWQLPRRTLVKQHVDGVDQRRLKVDGQRNGEHREHREQHADVRRIALGVHVVPQCNR
eukprot:1032818-Prymnesium_polylepis.1